MTILQSGIAQAAAASGGYQITRSLRFNPADSAYLSRTPASAGNRKTWTYSLWAKRSLISGTDLRFLEAGTGSGNAFWCGFNSSSQLYTQHYTGSFNFDITSSQVFRDVGAYFHFVYAVDTTQATAANRIKLYVNGVQITAFSSASYPSQNYDTLVNFTNLHTIGGQTIIGSGDFYGGYMADVRFIDGQALDPTSFGEFDANTGVWMPKTYSGTYGTNGFWLKFDDNSGTTATTLGKDSSGNSNNWTPNNFSVTAGVGNDSLVDSPTNYGTDTGAGGEVRGNYATLNPLDNALTLANGNLQATGGASWSGSRSTFAVSSGKWYWECQLTSSTDMMVGLMKQGVNIAAANGYVGNAAGSWGYSASNGQKYLAGAAGAAYGATWVVGDIIGLAFDADTGSLTCYKNNTSQGVLISGLTDGPYFPAISLASSSVAYINFGQRPFAYTAPSGFKALCTQNLPTPAIGATSSTLASKNFDVATYTGTGSSLSITSLAFQPDLAWIKGRSGATDHAIYDAVRGVQLDLVSNSTAAETTQAQGVTAFGSTGFTVGTLAKLNTSAATYVGWAFKGGGAAVTNTAGSISSQVSANTAAGISIITYTGNASSGTVGHGLGADPKLIICKSRNNTPNASPNWPVYHVDIGKDAGLCLNNTNATFSSANYWGTTTPNSTTFGMTGGDNNNGNMVAYCFAEVAGFSKFGKYTGNGSADGPFVYCGFRPRYVMIKRTDSVNSWVVYDSARATYNSNDGRLYPDLSNAESGGAAIDFLSNGFKPRNTDGQNNGSGGTYIFAAFAEAPFNYARAR